MGLFTTAILTLATAGTQIAGGIASNNEAKYNASILEQQAGMIDQQKSLEGYQYNRAIRQLEGKSVARTAKAGFNLSGSPMAVMIDSLTQMEMDKSIGQYNLEVQKRFTLSNAQNVRQRGKTAMISGFSNAFSTVLAGGFDYGMKAGMFSGSTLQTANSAMIRGTNGMATRVPTRTYKF